MDWLDKSSTLVPDNQGISSSDSSMDDFLKERELNLNIHVLNPSMNYALVGDASMKRNLAFVKKLSKITRETSSVLIEEAKSLKSSKFIEEIVRAVLENKWKKNADIRAAASLCSSLHRRYVEFHSVLSKELLPLLQCPEKNAIKMGNDEDEAKMQSIVAAHRCMLKFLIELFIIGVVENVGFILNTLKQFMHWDMIDKPKDLHYLSLLDNIARTYSNLLFVSDHSKNNVERHHDSDYVFLWSILSVDQKKSFGDEYLSYFNFIKDTLVNIQEGLRRTERLHREFYNTRGDLTEGQKKCHEEQLEDFDRLYMHLQSLSLSLGGLELPVLIRNVDREEIDFGESGLVIVGASSAPGSDIAVFDAAKLGGYYTLEEYQFYEELPKFDWMQPVKGPSNDQENISMDVNQPAVDDSLDVSDVLDLDLDVPDDLGDLRLAEEEEILIEEDSNSSLKQSLQSFLEKLSLLSTKEDVDKLALEFCYLASKNARRKLASELLDLGRRQSDMVPYYCRLLAVLHPYFPDIVTEYFSPVVVKSFRGYYFLNSKLMSVGQRMSRLKLARIIAELVKFKLISHGILFEFMKKLLYDFTGNNIEIFCTFLESTGRILYVRPDSNPRIQLLLNMMRKKKQSAYPPLSDQYAAQIENAYYVVMSVQDASTTVKTKVKTPLEIFLDSLLYKILDMKSVSFVLDKLLKLPWSDDCCRKLLSKYFVKTWRISDTRLSLFAQILYQLAVFYPAFVHLVVLNIVESLRDGLILAKMRDSQKLLSQIRFLAECGNAFLIDAAFLLELSYLIITMGHPNNFPMKNSVAVPSDPPHNTLRIRLVCTLLTYSNPSLASTLPLRQAVDKFLLFFQYYIFSKSSVIDIHPDIEYLILDTFESIRPRFRLASNFNEATRLFIESTNSGINSSPINDMSASIDRSDMPISDDSSSVIISSEICGRERTSSSPLPPNRSPEVSSAAGNFDDAFSFENDLKNLLTSSLEEREKQSQDAHLKKYISIDIPKLSTVYANSSTSGTSSPQSPVESGSIKYSVLVKKKNNKPVLKNLSLPVNAKIVQASLSMIRADEAELRQLKHQTLKVSDRGENYLTPALESAPKQTIIPRRSYHYQGC